MLARSSEQEDEVVVWDVIALDLTRRKQDEETAIRARTEMRRLTDELHRAEEVERRRIATGMHDDIGQSLAALKLKLSVVNRVESDVKREQGLQDCLDVVSTLIQKTRSLTFELSSPVLAELGLVPALETLLEKLCAEKRIGYDFSGPADDIAMSEQAKFILYRSARELINNAIRHANASQVDLQVVQIDGGVSIQVKDDGIGFDSSSMEQDFTSEGGFGLFNVREQMEYLGGSCKVGTASAGGAVFVLWIPLSE